MNCHRHAVLPILLAALMLRTGHGCADTWHQAASAKVSTEYDTNPVMSPTDTGGVWRNIFEPGYSLEGRLWENDLKTGLALQFMRSSNATLSPDRDSPSVYLDWLRLTDAGEFAINSKYAETATRDAGIDAIAQLPVTSTRFSRTLSGKWSKALSVRSTLTVDGSYEGVSYTGTGSAYVDYASRTSSMMFSYIWSEHSTPFFQLLHTDYEPIGGVSPSSFTNTVLVGLNWKASDFLEGNIQVGKTNINNSETSTQGGMSVQYTEQRSVYSLNANRQILPGGLGGFVTVDQTNAIWSYDLGERSKTGINMGLRKNHFITDTISRTAGAWLQYDLNSFWGLRTYYQRNALSGDGISEASSNILGLALSYAHTDF